MRFLTRALRNVFYVRVRKLYVRLWRSLRSRAVVVGGSQLDKDGGGCRRRRVSFCFLNVESVIEHVTLTCLDTVILFVV